MHVFHFGDSDKRLFGVYHPPAAQTPAATHGVVVCQPFGHEYIRAHRTLRTLARRLSDEGCHTLRFDYYGCGDSMGSGEESTVTQCLADIAAAIDELKDMAGVLRVSLVGVRLGGALAVLAAARRRDVDRIVLWDPVIRGDTHLQELSALQAEWLAGRTYMAVEDSSEIIGFPFSNQLRTEIADVDLCGVPKWPGRQTVVVTSLGVECTGLREQLERARVPSTFQQVSSSCDWTRPAAVHKALLAPEMVQQVVGAFERRGAA